VTGSALDNSRERFLRFGAYGGKTCGKENSSLTNRKCKGWE